MPRIPYVDPATASPELRATLAALPDLKVFRLVANAESAFKPWLRMGRAVLAETELDAVLRELVILRVAALHPGGEYERVHHEQLAREVGATEEQIEGARTGEGLEGDAALLVELTGQIMRVGEPDDPTLAAARDRLGPRQLMEVLLVIGHYQGLANIFAAAQIDIDPPSGSEVAASAEFRGTRRAG